MMKTPDKVSALPKRDYYPTLPSLVMDQTRLSREFPSNEAVLAASSSKSRELIHRESASQVAKSIYDKNLSRSQLITHNKLAEIPRFATREIQEGLVLGSGCFASVYEVRGFCIMQDDGRRLSLSRDDDEVDPGEIESRKFMDKHCYRSNGNARYAIKRLRQATIRESLSYMNGMADLATETLFLASLEHPNVIKLRGIAMEDMFSKEYFLILDRLYDTLSVRVRKWKKRSKQSQGIMGSFKDRNGSAKKQLFEERMKYGLDLAAAIAYIHKQMIIHRDLKSENIGFDVVSTTVSILSATFLSLMHCISPFHLFAFSEETLRFSTLALLGKCQGKKMDSRMKHICSRPALVHRDTW
jgi:hypothetical protein